uniref:Integrase catalytic domain-containing protein n=1 Tax=Chromera velia CCMP2878 TaxID=1169474 RepID=A0A0G4FB21_9ALVE|eukprot:Cvel_15992.t1-p1 / transcript=Cvel_15992.t1 / gene=Cvel_15992 / organism=Chromera_velia_CCMP2878 / gene_product=Putative Pol polyprotein, putative / transcript_product=Putative Pol polyprotein, putative / location=Cvel_scaffold1211:42903-46042(-) / protein_length=594 / sequence_SO=supercontig / SO=protein_coding / is_pseudo=false
MAGVTDHRRRRGLQGGTKSKFQPNRFPADKVRKEDNKKRCYRCNRTQPHECPVKPDDKCYNCGKKNHCQKLLEGLHLVVNSGCTKGLFPESFRRFVVKSVKNTTSFNTVETLSGKKKGKLTIYKDVVLTIPTMDATGWSVYTVWEKAMIKGNGRRALVPAPVGYCKNADHFVTPVKTIPGFSKRLRGPIINGLTVFPIWVPNRNVDADRAHLRALLHRHAEELINAVKRQIGSRDDSKQNKHPFNYKIFQDLTEMYDKGIGGFVYLSVIVDSSKRFKSLMALTTKDAALDHLIAWTAKWGAPTYICTDNGGEFVNHEYKKFCRERGITHLTGPAYTPAVQGIIERANREIKKVMKKLLDQYKFPHSAWPTLLPGVCYALNTTVHSVLDKHMDEPEVVDGDWIFPPDQEREVKITDLCELVEMAASTRAVKVLKGHVPTTKEEIAKGDFDESILTEMRKYKNNLAIYVMQKGEMPPDFDKAIPMRFVLTWKLKGNRRVPKTCLVVMGHRDSTVIETFSGTPDPGLVRAAIIYALSNSFACAKSDVSIAFLQAPMDVGKKVYIKLPTEIPAVVTEEIPEYMPGAIASANNALYGLK